ncbi:MAG: glycosyltransferase [Deltaproteobacteria bacterium]|nr:MAG: glycosyltransferase [Deltaproteobacteria bacterium]
MSASRASAALRSVRGAEPADQALSLSVIVPVYNEQHYVEASLDRLLCLRDPLIRSLQVIVVDDCSTDASLAVVRRVAERDARVQVLAHPHNRGKGGAVRTGIAAATGDVTVIHDADLEYHPDDLARVMVPFVREGADAVFGSRYLSAEYRRALMFRHTLINRTLTFLSNLATDLDLTDVETCYKAVRTPLLQSIPLRSDDFRIEIELAAKLAKRRARIFEVPIRYMPRSFQEGKKIRAKDGVLALGAMVHFKVVDDLYREDEYGSHILSDMEHAHRFNEWMAAQLRPWIGDRVLEIGAGIGTLTNHFIPRSRYLASDINPHYLHFLRSFATGKPYLDVRRIDAGRAEDFDGLEGQFDTAIMVNVLEHVADDAAALAHLHRALEPGGRAIVLVPQHPSLYGTLDEVLDHRERYTEERLRRSMVGAGFEVEELHDFNRLSVPGWWLNGRLLRRRHFSRVQLKILNTLMPVARRVDRAWPWSGLSLIAVGRKPG